MVYRAGTAKLMGALWSGRHGTPMLSVWENSGRVRFSSGTPYLLNQLRHGSLLVLVLGCWRRALLGCWIPQV